MSKMMLVCGSVPYKNKRDRKRKMYELKLEYGDNLKCWTENKFISYESRIERREIFSYQ